MLFKNLYEVCPGWQKMSLSDGKRELACGTKTEISDLPNIHVLLNLKVVITANMDDDAVLYVVLKG